MTTEEYLENHPEDALSPEQALLFDKQEESDEKAGRTAAENLKTMVNGFLSEISVYSNREKEEIFHRFSTELSRLDDRFIDRDLDSGMEEIRKSIRI